MIKRVIITIATLAVSLGVSSYSQKNEEVSQEKVVDTTKKTQGSTTSKSVEKEAETLEVQTLQLSQNNQVLTAELYIQDEAIVKEKVVVEGSFSMIGVSPKEEAEKAIESLEDQVKQIEGINTYYTILEDQVIYVSETEYEKVDFDFLNISEDMILADKRLPKAASRIQDNDWRVFKFEAILYFSLVGILANISAILAESKISIFALSTYNTDYVLVKKTDVLLAKQVLRKKHYEII